MQIHEITEGAFSSFMSGLTGGLTDKLQGAPKPPNLAQTSKKISGVWQNYADQLREVTPDPNRFNALYQQALTAFVQKNLLGGQPITNAINKQEINQLITQISAAKDNPQQVETLMNTLIKQTALSQQNVATPTQTLFKVISTDPAAVEYRGATYTINNNGQWANQKTGKVPDETFQTLLDNALNDAAPGSAPAPGQAGVIPQPTTAAPAKQTMPVMAKPSVNRAPKAKQRSKRRRGRRE